MSPACGFNLSQVVAKLFVSMQQTGSLNEDSIHFELEDNILSAQVLELKARLHSPMRTPEPHHFKRRKKQDQPDMLEQLVRRILTMLGEDTKDDLGDLGRSMVYVHYLANQNMS